MQGVSSRTLHAACDLPSHAQSNTRGVWYAAISTHMQGCDGCRAKKMPYIASMGIYVLKASAIRKLLQEHFPEVSPASLRWLCLDCIWTGSGLRASLLSASCTTCMRFIRVPYDSLRWRFCNHMLGTTLCFMQCDTMPEVQLFGMTLSGIVLSQRWCQEASFMTSHIHAPSHVLTQ